MNPAKLTTTMAGVLFSYSIYLCFTKRSSVVSSDDFAAFLHNIDNRQYTVKPEIFTPFLFWRISRF